MSGEISPIRLHKELSRIWGTPPGWARLSAVNHTVVGRRFMLAAFIFFAIGGLLAMIIRVQLATPESTFIGPEIYGQIFTMHGTVMMFLFAIPMFEGMALYLLPKMLGSRDLAFPRLSAYGFWCYVFGGSILILALLAGVAPDAGWFMYTPLSSGRYSPGINADVWLIGITFVEISAIGAAIEIVVTILKLRAPGMSLARMPIMAWYLLVTALMMLVGFPPLILGSILLEVERAFDWPFFDPTRGGDALLWQHLFWLFGHPEVYIIFLPAAGAVSMILPVLARHPLIGHNWIVVSVIGVGFLSFGLWVHHMFTVGIPHLGQAFFSAASMLVAIPTGVQIFAWLGTLMAGRPQRVLPMLFLFGFFFVFVLGGLTGVMLAVVPFNWQAHDTHFVVAHLHYVLVGGFIFPMLAAAYYWLPHLTGRETSYHLGYVSFWLIFIGFNVTFFLMHLTGLRGMPRRIEAYPAELGWETLNLISSVGGFLMAIGFALFATDVTLQMLYGRRARRNPWRAETLEWATPVPPTSYAFASLPVVGSRRPLEDDPDLPRKLAAGEGYLGFARNNWMEVLSVSTGGGDIDHLVMLPRRTFLPLWTALATGVFFLGLLFKLYWLSGIGLIVTVGLLLRWTKGMGLQRDHGPLEIGRGESALAHYEADYPPSRWAMIFALLADGILFGSLAFALLFLWVVAPAWPPADLISGGWLQAFALMAGLGASAMLTRRAIRSGDDATPRERSLLLAAATGLMAVAAAALFFMSVLPDPTRHAYAAVTAALVVYCLVHAAVGVIFSAYGLYRSKTGYVSAARRLDLVIAQHWHDYTFATALIAMVLVLVVPMVMT
ncbi:cytochrome ubiquinol oxidase subunit I [Agaricicola taiwanensis]|uniref:cytochrome-c oxidase n=1 Tax=Agaricicola taiwanensis TaxID=591372 RepID=A0A8J3E0B7_9RHOB|nr:cytochrome c oxidase subunit I [Agaricicola taiwanensis]GGE50755.1 cytochrome ubiquinol oxidase subunit I [Agaricicola taiwanensis]